MNNAPGVHLSLDLLQVELDSRPGLIPVNIDSASDRISWIDLEQYHFYRGFFAEAINDWAAIRGSDPDHFTSPLEVLENIRISDSIVPTGFIFHGGRCGSTLLSQVLARSRENIVFSEAPPHNQIWLRTDPPSSQLYRNLHLAMGRRRLPSYRSHIVKFTSFNILKFRDIRTAFPGVPALFLFREPAALMDSWHRAKPGWMGRELWAGHSLGTPEAAVESFFGAALAIADTDFRCLDYAGLTPESLPSVLAFLGLKPSPTDLRLMMESFSWDAKSGAPRSSVSLPKVTRTAPNTLQKLYEQLTACKPLQVQI